MKEAMQAYIDAFNRVDPDAIVALYAENATVEDPDQADGRPQTRKGIQHEGRSALRMVRERLPERFESRSSVVLLGLQPIRTR
ncbi:MAG: nuclear transport factor 2 family protein [Bdellovibrionota bacterium]